MTMYLIKLITLFGGLALFLFGMDVMGKALERQADGKLQTILAKMSSNVFKGFLLGFLALMTGMDIMGDSMAFLKEEPWFARLMVSFSNPIIGILFGAVLTAFERTADHCSNVAVEMLQVAEGKLEAHEYLNALKAGERSESAAFVERFAKYKAKYAFPEEP